MRTLIWTNDFVRAEKDKDDDILLLAIGTHDEVY